MITPKKVNDKLKEIGINGSIVRDSSGYYYFIGELFDIVPSIMSNNLRGWTMAEIINHITKHIKIKNKC